MKISLATVLLIYSIFSLASPQTDYMLHCQGCHLADGSGFPGKVPSFQGLADFLDIPGGRDFLVRVPGVAQALLDDRRTAALLNWILANLSGTQEPRPLTRFTTEEVSRLRHNPLDDVPGLRSQLLKEMKLAGLRR